MTLVEIMITLIISSIIAASTFMFFAGQQRIYETQTKILNLQQNVWAAMEVLTRYARSTGSGMLGCVQPASMADLSSGTGGRLLNPTPSPGPLTDDLTKRPQTGLRAFDDSTSTESMQWIPPLWIVNNSTKDANVLANTDILTVAFGNRTSGADTDAGLQDPITSPTDAVNLSLLGSGPCCGQMFRLGEFALLMALPQWAYGATVTPDRGCTLLQITSDPTGGSTLVHAHALPAGTPADTARIWNPSSNLLLTMLPAGGYVGGFASSGVRDFGQLVWVRFYVGNNPSSGVPSLWMQRLDLPAANQGSPQLLAEGVEDLQVAFACDTGPNDSHDLTKPDGNLWSGTTDDDRKKDEFWNNVPGDGLPDLGTQGFCNIPAVLRVTLVARSLTPDDLIDTGVTNNGPLDIEDHRYTTRPQDQFRRRVLTTTVYPRNNKPNI